MFKLIAEDGVQDHESVKPLETSKLFQAWPPQIPPTRTRNIKENPEKAFSEVLALGGGQEWFAGITANISPTSIPIPLIEVSLNA